MSVKVPWTADQVKSLNEYQKSDYFHPYTCGTEGCREILTATCNGWICGKCDYRQNWAHESATNYLWKKSVKELKRLRLKPLR